MTAFERTIVSLRRRLRDPLPGIDAHVTMAPVPRDAIEPSRRRGCREAGVLVLLVPREGHVHVLTTVRRGHLAHHAGQVSFPGGRREHRESALEAALREAREEVHLNPDDVEILGPLSSLYIPPSNYCVYPYVGFTDEEPDLRAHEFEVERIVHVPLTLLRKTETLVREYRTVREERLLVPFFRVDGLEIWGATAMVLAELLELVEDV